MAAGGTPPRPVSNPNSSPSFFDSLRIGANYILSSGKSAQGPGYEPIPKAGAKQAAAALNAGISAKWANYNAMGPAVTQAYNEQMSRLGGGDSSPTPIPTPAALDRKIQYNIGLPQDAYFMFNNTFQNENNMHADNRPAPISETTDLWSKSGGHKGMLVIYDTPTYHYLGAAPFTGDNDTTNARFGFQFHYNPTEIQMAISGAPNVDPAYLASGKDKFLGALTSIQSSTIVFNLVLNRKFDMKYYDSKTKKLRSGVSKNLYSPRQPSPSEQQQIYTMGTMYDVEFLLGAITGMKFSTELRNKTSDIGFLLNRLTELKLGSGMRYLGYVQSLQINHKHFDERMVPIYSEVAVTFTRFPDFKAFPVSQDLQGNIGTSAITSAGTPTPAPTTG
jgi:hypothetical protein